LSPILSRMGLFFCCGRFFKNPTPFDEGMRCYFGEIEVKSSGPTTLLWEKCVFGICGELWLSFRSFGVWSRVIGGVSRSWKAKTAEIGPE
jgi:hypothetical protein